MVQIWLINGKLMENTIFTDYYDFNSYKTCLFLLKFLEYFDAVFYNFLRILKEVSNMQHNWIWPHIGLYKKVFFLIGPFYPRKWGKMDLGRFFLIKLFSPVNYIKNSKCICHFVGMWPNVKDFFTKFPNIYILGFYLRSKSKIGPYYPCLL